MLKYLTSTACNLVCTAGKISSYATNQSLHAVVSCLQKPVNFFCDSLKGYSDIALNFGMGIKIADFLYSNKILTECFEGTIPNSLYNGIGYAAQQAQSLDIVNDLITSGILISATVSYGLPLVNCALNATHLAIDKIVPPYADEIGFLFAKNYNLTQTNEARIADQLEKLNHLIGDRVDSIHGLISPAQNAEQIEYVG